MVGGTVSTYPGNTTLDYTIESILKRARHTLCALIAAPTKENGDAWMAAKILAGVYPNAGLVWELLNDVQEGYVKATKRLYTTAHEALLNVSRQEQPSIKKYLVETKKGYKGIAETIPLLENYLMQIDIALGHREKEKWVEQDYNPEKENVCRFVSRTSKNMYNDLTNLSKKTKRRNSETVNAVNIMVFAASLVYSGTIEYTPELSGLMHKHLDSVKNYLSGAFVIGNTTSELDKYISKQQKK